MRAELQEMPEPAISCLSSGAGLDGGAASQRQGERAGTGTLLCRASPRPGEGRTGDSRAGSSMWEKGECAGQQESREGGVLNVASRLPEFLETPSGAGHVAGW